MNRDTPKSYEDYAFLLPDHEPESFFSRAHKALIQIESVEAQYPDIAELLRQELNRRIALKLSRMREQLRHRDSFD